jgi:hypothetical protein
VLAEQGPGFFFVHGTVPAKTLQSKDGENLAGEFFSRRDLPSMTDYRVRHLITG